MSPRAALAGMALLAAALPFAGMAQPVPANGPPASAPAAAAAPDSGEDAPDSGEPLPIPPIPPRIAEGAGYGHCLDMLATDPSGADALSATLAATDGAEAAQHCHALAQVELGNPAAGAGLLDRLAATSNAPAVSRAVIYGQADQAWTMAGNGERAYASANQALALSPDDPDLLIGRAIAALSLANPGQAADDLSHALALDPKRADALILHATALRELGKLDAAGADIERADRLDPDNPDLLLERGIIRQRRGDLAGARADWQHAAELAPDTSTADLAEQNLALLDAGPRQ
jgi:tetratricopeptide (TPR) repeat protein